MKENRIGRYGDLLVEVPLIALALIPLDPFLPLHSAVSTDSSGNTSLMAMILVDTVDPLPQEAVEQEQRSKIEREN